MKEQSRQIDAIKTEAKRIRLTADLPPELAEWLKSQAQKRRSSMNSEIVRALRLMREAEELIEDDPGYHPSISLIRIENMHGESRTCLLL